MNYAKTLILDVHPFAKKEWKAYIFTKTPLLDDSQKIIGTIFHGMDITSNAAFEVSSILSKNSFEGRKSDFLCQNSYMIGNSFGK